MYRWKKYWDSKIFRYLKENVKSNVFEFQESYLINQLDF